MRQLQLPGVHDADVFAAVADVGPTDQPELGVVPLGAEIEVPGGFGLTQGGRDVDARGIDDLAQRFARADVPPEQRPRVLAHHHAVVRRVEGLLLMRFGVVLVLGDELGDAFAGDGRRGGVLRERPTLHADGFFQPGTRHGEFGPAFGAVALHEDVTLADGRAWEDPRLDDEAISAEEDRRFLLALHNPHCPAVVLKRHDAQHDQPQRDHAERGEGGAGPVLVEAGVAGQPVDELAHRQAEPHHGRPDREHQTDREELGHDVERDRDEQEDAVRERGQAVEQQDEELAALARRRRFVLHTEDVLLEEVLLEVHRPLHEVGNLEQVRQDVVPVEPHERVGVEQHRRERGGEHRVVRDLLGQAAVLRAQPDERGAGGDEELKEHPARAHGHALPLVVERPSARSVHERRREQHEQHDAELGHLTAEAFTDQPVPGLVDRFRDDEDDNAPGPVGRRDRRAEAADE